MKSCAIIIVALTFFDILVLASPDNDENETIEKPSNVEWVKFTRGFKEKRLYQLTSVKQLLSKKPEQQVKAVDSAMAKIKAILIRNKAVLESSGLVSLEGRLPEEPKAREAVAFMLENTCFASDFLLRFPDIVHDVLASDGDFSSVLKWGLGFAEHAASSDSGNEDLFDQGTKKLIHLALMEIGVKEKSEDYHNRYAREDASNKPKKKLGFVEPTMGPPTKKPRKKMPRGPKMSKVEL